MDNKTKKPKASVLIVTLMILGIMLVTALSISLVSIRERKASLGSNRSSIAYQTADTGIEKVMDAITKNRSLSVADVIGGTFGFACNISNGHAVLTKAGESYSVELKKSTDAETTDCTVSTKLADIASIKSVGTASGQSQRAIEAAVAQAASYAGCAAYTLPASAVTSYDNPKVRINLGFGGKSNVCADGDGCTVRYAFYKANGNDLDRTWTQPEYIFQASNDTVGSAYDIGINGDSTVTIIDEPQADGTGWVILTDDCTGTGSGAWCHGLAENDPDAFTAYSYPANTKAILTMCD